MDIDKFRAGLVEWVGERAPDNEQLNDMVFALSNDPDLWDTLKREVESIAAIRARDALAEPEPSPR